ncbi:galactosylgalactosylxylosylprotein 3-beta-glucuronosyltransferase 1-like isoform X2 [Scyliorhinus torazame]|uniref:galactosylgalactosylxylosylprotein 3-beta-glucuronosyltransferase 1-like isoform X2 n=1 Tax=Scyliorhinus torazame TaxID=75743 RepID=UPI003B5B64BE
MTGKCSSHTEEPDNGTKRALVNSSQNKEEPGGCVHQDAILTQQVIKLEYIYTRPPQWSQSLPTIYVITPTYTRPVQKAELTRLANTFLHVRNLHWIVVEDSPRRTGLVALLLEKNGLNFTHLNVQSPKSVKLGISKSSSRTPRGTLQRNLGLRWLRDSLSPNDSSEGVVYFADDDNTYSLELFEEMRFTKKVSVWPVAFVGGLLFESPKVNTAGKVVGWKTVFDPNRPFAIDMAGFAINVKLILMKSSANFQLYGVKGGYQETSLLRELVTLKELEPKASNCTKEIQNNRRQRKTKKEKDNMKTDIMIYIWIVVGSLQLCADATPLTPTPQAVNVSHPWNTPHPETATDTPTWCDKFIKWYSLSYIVIALLVIAILCSVIQPLRLRKWRRKASRTLVYIIRPPIFGLQPTPHSL